MRYSFRRMPMQPAICMECADEKGDGKPVRREQKESFDPILAMAAFANEDGHELLETIKPRLSQQKRLTVNAALQARREQKESDPALRIRYALGEAETDRGGQIDHASLFRELSHCRFALRKGLSKGLGRAATAEARLRDMTGRLGPLLSAEQKGSAAIMPLMMELMGQKMGPLGPLMQMMQLQQKKGKGDSPKPGMNPMELFPLMAAMGKGAEGKGPDPGLMAQMASLLGKQKEG